MADIEEYRTYLATENPIAEIETRFLEPADDLVCLAPAARAPSPELQRSYSPFSDDALTPMPRKMTFDSSTGAGSASTSRASSRQGEASPAQSVKGDVAEGRSASLMGPTGSMSSLPVIGALGLILSLLSLLAFPMITDFSSRIAVVLVASIAVAALKRNAEAA
ncbi:hypothetical protein GQ53DRAFT_754398 [Thozetella sp. PMI_491]|nr:hypothetical protein GQ53DRAFT_754398 [Thozetella sp. PMI_491]